MKRVIVFSLLLVTLSVLAAAGPANAQEEVAIPKLTAEVSEGAIELNWEAVPGAVRYELMVWWDPLPTWQPIEDNNITGTSYTHTDVTAGTEYYYTIQAVDAEGKKSGWLQAFATATVQAAPAARTPATTPTPSAIPTSTLIPTLTPTQRTGAWTSTATLTPTPTPTHRAAPTATTAPFSAPALTAESTERGVVLNWGAVQGAVRYELMVWWDPLPTWQRLEDNNITGSSYTHTDVTAGTEYYYSIQAVDAEGKKSGWLQAFATATFPAAPAGGTSMATPTPTATTLTTPTPTPTWYLATEATDRQVLVALYQATNGADWDNNTNWLSDKPLGEWHGVGTGYWGRVVSLHLDNNRMSGSIPAELGDLTYLRHLYLYDNRLSGSIPAELGDLHNLHVLIFSNNRLSGLIPAELGELTYLNQLSLHSNQLSGSIPAELGDLTYLRYLYLSNNRLRGCVPAVLRHVEENDLAGLGLADCGPPAPTPTPTLTPTPVTQTVTRPPTSLGLDPLYEKHLDAGGIPVVAPSDVDDAELHLAAATMLGMLSDRPDVIATGSANGFRVILLDRDGKIDTICQLPEYIDRYADHCPRRIGHEQGGIWFSESRQDLLVVVPVFGRGEACNGLFIHEIGHMVEYALKYRLPGSTVYDPAFWPRVESAYEAAMQAGLWQNTYSSANAQEYWAEAVKSWFDPAGSYLPGQGGLAGYDPAIAGLVAEVFGDATNAALPPVCR